ncbi:hypothetical protein BJX99DRAFT_221394 [Aspergillus californicus]
MLSVQSPLWRLRSSLRLSIIPGLPQNSVRYASLNHAIGRGIRRSQRLQDPRISLSNSNDHSPRFEKRPAKPQGPKNEQNERFRPSRREDNTEIDTDEFIRSGNFRALPFEHQRSESMQRPSNRDGFNPSKSRTHSNYGSKTERYQRSDFQDQRRPDRDGRKPDYGSREASNYGSRPERYQRNDFKDQDRPGRDGTTYPYKYMDRKPDHDSRGASKYGSRPERYQRNDFQDQRSDFKYQDRPARFQSDRKPDYSSRGPSKYRPEADFQPQRPDSQLQRRPSRVGKEAPHKFSEKSPERVKDHVKVPDTIPYTSPASEFIYGTSAVEAALRCSRRQLYKLYVYQAANEELSGAKALLRKLALAKDVQIKMAFAEWDRLLDRMSAGRPHNGCILEASPLPQTPVKALKPVQPEEDHFRLELAPQTREEALVNGTNDLVTINQSFAQPQRKHPVVLLLDGVLDQGNLGAIIRSSYYLGVDAVVFAGRNSAPLSPITIKASAGAAENMTLLHVTNEVDFIQRSKENGWRFYAADAPSPGAIYIDPSPLLEGSLEATDGVPAAENLITASPTVIMMGSESNGLSNHIRTQADSIVSIPGARASPTLGAASDPARVDSLNVSVAAALLMEAFLRVPLGVSPVPRKENSRENSKPKSPSYMF